MGKICDISGKKFNKLTALYPIRDGNRNMQWWCRCECGIEKPVSYQNLVKGRTKSCGCSKSMYLRTARKNLVGKQFGRLTVIDRDYSRKQKGTYWWCLCQCGSMTSVPSDKLNSGHTQSCGCLHNDLLAERHLTHGDSASRLYNIWAGMRNRCNNENNQAYKHYGGRGISICKEWDDSYETFKEWAVSHGYSEHLTIDRIDVNGDYCPENCKWSTDKEQSRNTRRNIMLTLNGETKCVSAWAEELGVNPFTLYRRIDYGWDAEKVLTTPVRKLNRKKVVTKEL